MQKEKEQRKVLHGFTVSYLREGVIGADCSAALQTLGCFFPPRFRFDMLPDLGDVNRVQLPHPEILEALKPGKQLLPGRNCGRADELMLARGTTMLP